MANNKVWCLLIDHDRKPTFGEPFPIPIHYDDTIHDLKVKLKMGTDKIFHLAPNEIEFWKCKTLNLKLSANDSFGRTKERLSGFKFGDDKNSDVEHLGVARKVLTIGFEQGEVLLALVPRNA